MIEVICISAMILWAGKSTEKLNAVESGNELSLKWLTFSLK